MALAFSHPSENSKNSFSQTSKLISTNEVAALLGSKEKTIRQWVYQGKIPYLKINGLVRFDRTVIEQWIEGQQKKYDLVS